VHFAYQKQNCSIQGVSGNYSAYAQFRVSSNDNTDLTSSYPQVLATPNAFETSRSLLFVATERAFVRTDSFESEWHLLAGSGDSKVYNLAPCAEFAQSQRTQKPFSAKFSMQQVQSEDAFVLAEQLISS